MPQRPWEKLCNVLKDTAIFLSLLVEITTTAQAQATVVLQSALHTLSLKIFHQQVTDFPIHRRSEMLLPIKEVDHLPW